MDLKISAMPNDADKFLMRIKLQEQAQIVRVSWNFLDRQNKCLDYSHGCSF